MLRWLKIGQWCLMTMVVNYRDDDGRCLRRKTRNNENEEKKTPCDRSVHTRVLILLLLLTHIHVHKVVYLYICTKKNNWVENCTVFGCFFYSTVNHLIGISASGTCLFYAINAFDIQSNVCLFIYNMHKKTEKFTATWERRKCSRHTSTPKKHRRRNQSQICVIRLSFTLYTTEKIL